MVTPSKTVEFERSHLVPIKLERVFLELRDDGYLRGHDIGTFSYRAAVYLEDLNRIHPFREGNGRVQRVFLEILALQAGHILDRSLIDQEMWLEGSIQSFGQPIDGDHEIMTDVIRQAISTG